MIRPIAIFMGLGVLTVVVCGVLVAYLPAWSATRAISPIFLWAYAAIFIGFWLAFFIGWRALSRFVDPAQRDGSTPLPGSKGDIDARVLQNTLEQTVLALLASGLVALSHAPHAGMLLLAHAGLFFASRPLFWLGYRAHPAWRTYGFSVGFYSSLAMYGYAAQFFLRALFH